MNEQRKFNVELTYNQIMALIMVIDVYIIEMDRLGKDVIKDKGCKLLRLSKKELLKGYLGK